MVNENSTRGEYEGWNVADNDAAQRSGAGDDAAAPVREATVPELLALLPDPVIGCDITGAIVYWNAAAREAYGYASDEALGAPLATLLRTESAMPIAEILEELADLGRWSGRLTRRDKEGRSHAVESRWTARYDDSGQVIGMFGIERELTQLTALGEPPPAVSRPAQGGDRESPLQLRRAERLESLGQLAGGVAHDFNNALAIIINYAAFVASEIERLRPAPAEPQRASIRADLEEIQNAAQRAAQLTQQLLSFSRQEVGTPVTLNLNDTIAEVRDLLARTAGEHIRLETRLADGLHPIRADPSQLQQALVNLAANARDAMPQGGTLTIDTANLALAGGGDAAEDLEPGPYVRLRVSDTGIGMAANVLEHAFDPFFTTKPLGYGTGLGLSSVYGIVTRAGGHAELHSRVGFGTTFVSLLPADVAQEVGRVAPLQDGAEPVLHGRTVLLVEDERALRDVAARILDQAGCQVICADGGAAALTAAAAHQGEIDLLLTDMVMPGMLGHQLADRLRARRPDVRVLYMSGFSEWLLGQSTSIDRAALIAKPFTGPALLAQVRLTLAEAESPAR
jgi:PAS domain S-box-containing protein